MSHVYFPYAGGALQKILVGPKWAARWYGHLPIHWVARHALRRELPLYGIDSLLIAMLHADIDDVPFDFDQHALEPVRSAVAINSSGQGVLLDQFPKRLIDKLAQLNDESVPDIADRWGRHEEFLSSANTPELRVALEKVIVRLRELAALASASNTPMFSWAFVP
jgi:hypothetical protein